MIKRDIAKKVLRFSHQYPVVTITGPRQSGKTTLCKNLFAEKRYVSLESLDVRERASSDPRGFLKDLEGGAVIDEIQRVPQLLSYIQTEVDEKGGEGLFILTGSQQFNLLDSVNQSLAGRTALATLLPFSLSELSRDLRGKPIEDILFQGFYPRIYDKNLDPSEALSFYIDTYVERDIRSLLQVKDLSKFEHFLRLCAARTGQILNYSSLGNDCGVNHNTIKSWLSVLEASYIITLLRPHHKNYRKRLVKAPKLYFLDTGLAAYLLGIEEPSQLKFHPLKGALFETLVVSELLKQRFNEARKSNLYYFRDNVGNEVDLILDFGERQIPAEIKLSQTVSSSFLKGLDLYEKISGEKNRLLVYGGDRSYLQGKTAVTAFRDLPGLMKRAGSRELWSPS